PGASTLRASSDRETRIRMSLPRLNGRRVAQRWHRRLNIGISRQKMSLRSASVDSMQTRKRQLCKREVKFRGAILSVFLVQSSLIANDTPEPVQPTATASRLTDNQRHSLLASQPTGLLIPLYLYPANIHTNAEFNRLIELKLSHPRVPVCVIVNPA